MVAALAQTVPSSASAVLVTFALFALFLSVTAHVAVRNVLGDVPVRAAFGVGPLPAAIGFVFAALELPPFLGILLAVLADGLAIGYFYDQDRRLTAYITFIHVVVSVILGTVLVALLMLASTAPV